MKKQQMKITKKQNAPLPKGLFKSEISAIVGIEDQTSALNLICEAVKNNELLTSDFIVVYEMNDKLYHLSNVDFNKPNFDILVGNVKDFDKLDVMYYSNQFKPNNLATFGDQVKDLSISKMIEDNKLNDLLDIQTRFIYSPLSGLADQDQKPMYKSNGNKGRWSNINNEEMIYVNLLSMVYDSYETLEDVGKKETLICIDLIDAGMHPNAQINLVERLTNDIKKVTGNNVQIVITTNSVIVVSDIPKQCLTVMDKQDRQSATFGGNYYDIQKKVFVGDYRTGNISHRYILEMCKLSDKDENTDKEILQLKESLNIIDDELISFHIKNKLEKYE